MSGEKNVRTPPEKGATRRKSGGLWAAVARGAALSLVLWVCGVGALTGVMTAGGVGESGTFSVLSALTALASFVGGFLAARSAPWGSLTLSLLVTVAFLVVLLRLGLSLWREIAWTGHGGTLILWSVIGGVAAGILGRPRPKRRSRRTW